MQQTKNIEMDQYYVRHREGKKYKSVVKGRRGALKVGGNRKRGGAGGNILKKREIEQQKIIDLGCFSEYFERISDLRGPVGQQRQKQIISEQS